MKKSLIYEFKKVVTLIMEVPLQKHCLRIYISLYFQGLIFQLNSFPSYLYLNLIENNFTHKKLEKCYIQGKKHYILNGTYLAPFASKLVMCKYANGMNLDTTWTVLSKYVTSLPTIIVQNVGIPIGMSFGLTEDNLIYNDFFFIIIMFLDMKLLNSLMLSRRIKENL